MTTKRLKKLYMAQGVPRDTAEFITKHIAVMKPNGYRYSNQEKYDNISVITGRIKRHE